MYFIITGILLTDIEVSVRYHPWGGGGGGDGVEEGMCCP